jgi:hypothetical protein
MSAAFSREALRRASRGPSAAAKALGHCVVQFVDPLIYPPLFDPNVVQFVVVGAGRTTRTFSATFFLACLAAMELQGVVLEEI